MRQNFIKYFFVFSLALVGCAFTAQETPITEVPTAQAEVNSGYEIAIPSFNQEVDLYEFKNYINERYENDGYNGNACYDYSISDYIMVTESGQEIPVYNTMTFIIDGSVYDYEKTTEVIAKNIMDNFDGFNMVVIWDDYTFAAFTNASTGEIEMTIDDFNANNIMENIILGEKVSLFRTVHINNYGYTENTMYNLKERFGATDCRYCYLVTPREMVINGMITNTWLPCFILEFEGNYDEFTIENIPSSSNLFMLFDDKVVFRDAVTMEQSYIDMDEFLAIQDGSMSAVFEFKQQQPLVDETIISGPDDSETPIYNPNHELSEEEQIMQFLPKTTQIYIDWSARETCIENGWEPWLIIHIDGTIEEYGDLVNSHIADKTESMEIQLNDGVIQLEHYGSQGVIFTDSGEIILRNDSIYNGGVSQDY